MEVMMVAYTAVEKRAFVLEYMDQPYGAKASWLAAQPFSAHTFKDWRLAYLGGSLDHGLVPRNAETVNHSGHRLRHVEKDLAAKQAEPERIRDQNDKLQATNEALGKAIGLMQKWSEHTPGCTPTPTEPKD